MLNRMLLANTGKSFLTHDVICYGVSTIQDACFEAEELLTANQIIDLEETDGIVKFNFQDIDSMEEMFYSMGLTSVIFSRFDTSNISNMARMFKNCADINIIDLSRFDTSNIVNMAYMFDDCYEVSRIDISSFNTRNVNIFAGMFGNCGNSTQEGCTINCPQGLDMSGITYDQQAMTDMFTGANFTNPIHLKNVLSSFIESGSSPDDWTLPEGLCGGTRGTHYIIDSIRD